MSHSLSPLAKLTPALRIPIFLLGIVGLWLPLALPWYWLASRGILALGGAIATALLYLIFLGLWPLWARRVHRLSHPWQRLGVVWHPSLGAELATGLGLGLGGIACLIAIEAGLGWGELQPLSWALGGRLALEGALVGLAVGCAEELLFRGWLLFELEQGYSPAMALGADAALFAIAHFIKPLPAILATLPQFLGLLLLGTTLVLARRTPSRHRLAGPDTALGFPVGLHGGLVWGYYIVNVGQVIRPSGRVPEWVTGIGQNPLAGLLGLGLLAVLAWIFYQGGRGRLKLPPL